MPLMGSELLESARSRIAASETELSRQGVSVESEMSPVGRDPASIRVILETDDRLGEVIVWENGMAELSFAEVASGNVTNEHRKIANQADLGAAFDAIFEWIQ